MTKKVKACFTKVTNDQDHDEVSRVLKSKTRICCCRGFVVLIFHSFRKPSGHDTTEINKSYDYVSISPFIDVHFLEYVLNLITSIRTFLVEDNYKVRGLSIESIRSPHERRNGNPGNHGRLKWFYLLHM